MFVDCCVLCRERSAKQLGERIELFENSLGEVCQQLNVYLQKVARMRDEGDALAQSILKLAEPETVCRSLKLGLTSFAENVAAVQDYRDAQVSKSCPACTTIRLARSRLGAAAGSESSHRVVCVRRPVFKCEGRQTMTSRCCVTW